MFHYNLHVFIFDFVVVFVFVIVFCYFLINYSTNSFCFLQFIAKFCTVKSFISLSNTIESSRERTLCVLTRRQLAEKYEMAASVQNLPRTNRWQRSAASVDCDRTVAVPATATETLTALVAAAATTLKNESIACASVRVCMCASFRASVCEPAFEQLLSLTNTRTHTHTQAEQYAKAKAEAEFVVVVFGIVYFFGNCHCCVGVDSDSATTTPTTATKQRQTRSTYSIKFLL